MMFSKTTPSPTLPPVATLMRFVTPLQEIVFQFKADASPYLLTAFLGCWLGGVFDGLDSSLMHLTMPLALKELTGQPIATVAHLGGWITAIFLVGWTLGGFVFGTLGDKYGRIKAMIGSILLYSVCTGLCGLAHSWQELAAYRFLTGLGIGGELVSITAFLTEVWPATSRVQAVALLITSYQVGQLLAGGVNLLVLEWRHAFFIGALPAVLTLFIRRGLNESEQWIEAQRERLQHEALAQAGASSTGTDHFNPWQQLWQQGCQRDLWVGSVAFTAFLIVTWAAMAWIPSWVSSLPNAPTDARQTQVMIQSACALLGCAVAAFSTQLWGRKASLQLGCAGMLVCMMVLFTGFQHVTPWLYAVGGVFGLFHGLTQSSMYVYIPELFPTLVRMSGTGFCFNVGRLVTALAVVGMGYLVSALGGFAPAALVFGLFNLVAIVALCFGRESRSTGVLTASR